MNTTLPSWIKLHSNGSLLFLHIQPGASRSFIIGNHGSRLKVKLKSAPEKGRANDELLDLFSELLGISKSRVHLLKGTQSRQKDLLVELPPHEVIKLITKLG